MKRTLLVAVLLGLAAGVMSSPAAAQAGSNSLDVQLLQAAGNGDTAAVQQLLDKGANIEARDEYGRTPLMLAVEYQDRTEIAKLLLDKGANIEAKASVSPYEGWTALIFAANGGKVEIAKLLLDKGANIEAKASVSPHEGWTALFFAANGGKVEAAKLLLEKGANIESKDRRGYTALAWAKMQSESDEGVLKLSPGHPLYQRILSNQIEVVHLLEQAIAKNPQSALAESASALQRRPYDEALGEKVFKLAASLPALPPVPEEARQLFLQASALMKQANIPDDFVKPIELLEKALVIAPWWGNAYYNLSRALELSGQYDEAVKQLNYYIELSPSEADATEARAHISVIQAEKEAAAQKKRENEGVLAVKYVSGGITRQRYSEVPAWWHESGRVDALYTYMLPEEGPFYVNVFRMPRGHLLTISLFALSSNGAYTGDQIAVYAWDETKGGCSEGYMFAFGAHSYTDACGVHYDVSVSNQPNAIVTVTYTPTGAFVTIPVALLYRGRVLKVGWDSTGTVYQGSHDKGVEVLHFDGSMVEAAKNPNVNAMGLTPTSVIPHKK